MVEQAAGVLPPAAPSPTGREWPRMDPPNVLWFFGALAIAFAVNVLFDAIPDTHNGLWDFLVALGFMLGFAAASWLLLRAWWWVPAGLAAFLAVASFPGVAIGFLNLVDVWPDDPFFEPLEKFSGWAFGVALATALVGIAAFLLTRFVFILAEVVTAILIASFLLVPAFESPPGGGDDATMALVVGAGLVIVAVFLDAFGRRRDAFWFHVLGLLAVAGALVFWASGSNGDPEQGWVPMLIAGTVILVLAGPVRRATWAVYGVLGYYAAIAHYLVDGLNEDRWPFALLLLAVGLSIFLLGIAAYRYSGPWSQRFVRRPLPQPPAPPV